MTLNRYWPPFVLDQFYQWYFSMQMSLTSIIMYLGLALPFFCFWSFQSSWYSPMYLLAKEQCLLVSPLIVVYHVLIWLAFSTNLLVTLAVQGISNIYLTNTSLHPSSSSEFVRPHFRINCPTLWQVWYITFQYSFCYSLNVTYYMGHFSSPEIQLLIGLFCS